LYLLKIGGAAAFANVLVLNGSTASTTIRPTRDVSDANDWTPTSLAAASAGARNSNIPSPAAPAVEMMLPASNRMVALLYESSTPN
jgi:hypothetical protein